MARLDKALESYLSRALETDPVEQIPVSVELRVPIAENELNDLLEFLAKRNQAPAEFVPFTSTVNTTLSADEISAVVKRPGISVIRLRIDRQIF